MMNYLDFIVIYLACGSPFGVYYFLNQRYKTKSSSLKAFLVTIVWIPFAIALFHTRVTKMLRRNEKSSNRQKLDSLQKKLEDHFSSDSDEIPLFELRETIERYMELTLIISEMNQIPALHEIEFYKTSGSSNVELSAICLHRRNQKRLISHQINARKDFINSIEILLTESSGIKKLGEDSCEFVRILNDEEALSSIEMIFKKYRQTNGKPTVKDWGTEIWKPQELKQPNEKSISIPLQTTTTAALQKKD